MFLYRLYRVLDAVSQYEHCRFQNPVTNFSLSLFYSLSIYTFEFFLCLLFPFLRSLRAYRKNENFRAVTRTTGEWRLVLQSADGTGFPRRRGCVMHRRALIYAAITHRQDVAGKEKGKKERAYSVVTGTAKIRATFMAVPS